MIELRVCAGAEARVLDQVKLMALRFPGEHVLKLVVEAPKRSRREWPVATRTLTLGPEWRFDGSPACMAGLGEFGDVELTDALG
jgi:hypothetical protein